MKFDPTLIQQFLSSPSFVESSSVASLCSFIQGVISYFGEKKRCESQGTIDDYLEWLRRQNHAELLTLLIQNKESFEKLFATLQYSVLDAIGVVNENVNRLRTELTDLEVVPSKIELSICPNSWSAACGIFIKGRSQPTKLMADLTIINWNLSKPTIISVSGWVRHRGNRIKICCGCKKTTVDGGGDSVVIKLTTTSKCDWQQADDVADVQVQLSLDQVSDPILYRQIDSGFQYIGGV